MPLDRLVLILVCVIAAAGVTVALASLLTGVVAVPAMAGVLIPALLILYVVWRVIAQRLSEDDRYDRTPRD